MSAFDPTKVPEGTLVIKTGRNEEVINLAVKEGFRPLVLPVMPSPKLRANRAIFQHKKTDEVLFSGDYRVE